MRLVSSSDRMKRNGPAMPGLPAWYREWLNKYGKYVELKCGCIIDINLPSCISILTSKPQIDCETHGFQPIKRSVKFREVIASRYGIIIPPDPDPEGLFPPF